MTLDARQDINYDLMTESIDAYFFRNIYVERGVQEMGIMYPNRLYQYTRKDFYSDSDDKEFTTTSSAKFDVRFNTQTLPVTKEFTRQTNFTFSKWQRETNLNGGKID